MDKTVADLNVAHFKRLLETETDADKRKILERLLMEEEAKLASLMENASPPDKKPGC